MQGIVIQGSTGYVDEVIDLYKDIPNVVFSTWEDEPEENIQLIKSKGILDTQSSLGVKYAGSFCPNILLTVLARLGRLGGVENF